MPTILRQCRDELCLSQAAFAARLGVAVETYRTWDAGRRMPPAAIVRQAHALAGHPDKHQLLPLPVLARMVGVHVRTLHLAARLGRLPVEYDTRTTFRRLRPRATLAAAVMFRSMHYRKHGRRGSVPPPLTWDAIPADWSEQILRLRMHLGLSQAEFARVIGAARKAIVGHTAEPMLLALERFASRTTPFAVPASSNRLMGARASAAPAATRCPWGLDDECPTVLVEAEEHWAAHFTLSPLPSG